MKREYMTVSSIQAGIINCVDADGEIHRYRQRGIQDIQQKKRLALISLGLLDLHWSSYEELPKNVSITFERRMELGRARATYPRIDIDKTLAVVVEDIEQDDV